MEQQSISVSDKADLTLYQAELAKVDFQNNIGSLCEIQSRIGQHFARAKQRAEGFASVSRVELEVIASHLINIISGLAGNYYIIDNTNKMLVFRNRILENSNQTHDNYANS